jgi:hypothetical protein
MRSVNRPQKITFGEMREMGVRGLLVYCSDYHCSHSIAITADLRPDFNWAKKAAAGSRINPQRRHQA